MCILNFKKHAFTDRVFPLILVCRKQSMQMQEFYQTLQYLKGYFIGIIAGDFNYDLLEVSKNKFLICPDCK